MNIFDQIRPYLISIAVLILFSQIISLSHKPVKRNAVTKNFDIYSFSGNKVSVPDFSAIQDISKKKEAFFRFMRPIIEHENRLVNAKRKRILNILEKKFRFKAEKAVVAKIAREYGLDSFNINDKKNCDALLARVDIVPAPLAMIQSANETAWGTSRFARLGNNMFGQWCFTKGKGIVPKRRNAGAVHEVARFNSINASVASYIHNLNTGKSYKKFRSIRHEIRSKGEYPDPEKLAYGLTKYSELGKKYVRIIISMLRTNSEYLKGK